MATPQDLSVTKQHRNDRWDRCTASDGDWQIITTTSHRSANQRYFMHNSATVHRMRMPSSALDSSCSQLCNDTSTGVVRHQITKWRRLQNVVSYRVLHRPDRIEAPPPLAAAFIYMYRLITGVSISGLLRKRATANPFTRASCYSRSSRANTRTTV